MSEQDASILFMCSTYFSYLEHSLFVSYLRQNIVTQQERLKVDRTFESLKVIFENSWIRSNIGLALEIHLNCLKLKEDLRYLTNKYAYCSSTQYDH
jgi:hypothetical protein